MAFYAHQAIYFHFETVIFRSIITRTQRGPRNSLYY